MAVYEDDPRLKPKRDTYGGSTGRSAAKRGEPRKSTGSMPGPRKDPRLPPAPRREGSDRLDWDKFPTTRAPETGTYRQFSRLGQMIDAGVRDIVKASPLGAWLTKDAPSKPSLQDWLDATKTSDRIWEFKQNKEDSGIQAWRLPMSGTDPILRVKGSPVRWNGRT